ncbi:hypothetical protein C1H46_011647 [Malus baccata]|uniref:Ubiquitin-like protease family profile domain-containing protein n=1 Tax=Malus baccata TaxID=106549 RepID=A0A540MWV4_MALBA|nr:hypothetical protein C1H46_011647 [Malus baccata]
MQVIGYGGDDASVVMPGTFTSDTNDVGELKVQIKELKVALACLAHEKDILERELVQEGEERTLAHHGKSMVPTTRQQGDCSIFTLQVIEFVSTCLPLEEITPSNVHEFRLRMAIDMLHELHNA